MTAWRAFAGQTVADAMGRGRDNFGLVRLALALAVVVSHAFSIPTGHNADEPLVPSTGFTLGEHAVNGFFAVSGFLVTMSLATRGWRDYAIARLLRIGPGFVVATLVVAFGIGAALTSVPLGAYLSDQGLWRFLYATLTSFKTAIALPGVFAQNPFVYPMGTVWTLKYEVICYAALLGFGLAGALRWRVSALLLPAFLFVGLAALLLIKGQVPKGVETAFRLPLIFACGAALYLWRDKASLSLPVLLVMAGLTVLARATPLFTPLLFVTESYGILWLALAAPSSDRLDPRSDLSYGVYLYGWPIQQSLHALFPVGDRWLLLACATALSLMIAFASWRLVEWPALLLKARLVRRRTNEGDLVAP